MYVRRGSDGNVIIYHQDTILTSAKRRKICILRDSRRFALESGDVCTCCNASYVMTTIKKNTKNLEELLVFFQYSKMQSLKGSYESL